MKLYKLSGPKGRYTILMTIPVFVREVLGWRDGDHVFVTRVSREDDTITLRRVRGDPAHDSIIPMPSGTALASDLPTGTWPPAAKRKRRPDYARGNDWQEASELASEASGGDKNKG